MVRAKSLLDANSTEGGPILSNLELARLIANTAGNKDIFLTLLRLQKLLKEHGRLALKILHACEEQFGRDGIDGEGPILVPDSMDAIEFDL
jgi:hypothetical protein